MAEQQLIDYIKKARQAGQADEQTRSLLYKNGWLEAEVNEALTALQPQVRPQAQPQPEPQIRVQQQQVRPQQPRPEQIFKMEDDAQSKTTTYSSQPAQAQYKPAQQLQQASNLPKMRGGSHLILKLLIVLIILVVLGGVGLYIGGQYINIPYNPFSPNPAIVLNKMVENMKNLKSYSTSGQGEFSLPQGKMTFNWTSTNNIQDTANPQSAAGFSLEVDGQGSATPIFATDINIATIGEALYFIVNNLTLPENNSYTSLNLEKIKSQWIKIDTASVESLSSSGLSNPNNSLAKVPNSISFDSLFQVDKKLGDETVNGQKAYHFRLKLSKEKLKEFYSKLITELQKQQTVTANSAETQMAVAAASSVIDTIGDIESDVWIGKNDNLLYKFNLNKQFNLNILSLPIPVKINIVGNYSDFNKEMSVQVPNEAQSAKKLEDILSPMLKIQKISADMSKIGPVAQTILLRDGSYSLICRLGLLSGRIQMGLLALSNDIVSQGGKAPVCFAGAKDYCVSTQLEDGSYMCIGKTGILGKTRCVSYTTVCK